MGKAKDPTQQLREHLLELLRGQSAHASFDDIVAEWPVELRGVKPVGLPYTAWQVLEHLRIAQWDILEFSRNPRHVSPDYPDGYWPETEQPADEASWGKSVANFTEDLGRMRALVEEGDLFTPFAHGSGQTLLRETMLVADHNAYHLGQLVTIRRLLGAWPGG